MTWSVAQPDAQVDSVISQLQALTGNPARISLDDPRTPDGTVKIPGTIRQVTPGGMTVELFFPLTAPRTGAPVILEIMAQAALLQACTIIHHSSNPQCLHLVLPDRLYPVQRRRYPRVEVKVEATVTPAGSQASVPAMVVNLSAGGCALTLNQPLTIGTTVRLSLHATGLNPAEATAQVVRNTLSTVPGSQWKAGLAFDCLTKEQEEQLVSYVDLYM